MVENVAYLESVVTRVKHRVGNHWYLSIFIVVNLLKSFLSPFSFFFSIIIIKRIKIWYFSISNVRSWWILSLIFFVIAIRLKYQEMYFKNVCLFNNKYQVKKCLMKFLRSEIILLIIGSHALSMLEKYDDISGSLYKG